MLELLSGWSILLLLVGLIVVFFWRDRSGTPDKLSSSGDSEKYLPVQRGEDEGNVSSVETRSDTKPSSELPLEEDRVLKQEEEEAENESLRRRVSGRKTDKENESKGHGDELHRPSKEKQVHIFHQQLGDSVESQEEIIENSEIVPTEAVSEPSIQKVNVRLEKQRIGDKNNTETFDFTSNVNVCSTSRGSVSADSSGDHQRREIVRVPEIILNEAAEKHNEEKEEISREQPTVDNTNNIENDVSISSKELGTAENVLAQRDAGNDKLSDIVLIETTVKAKGQENRVVEEEPDVTDKLEIGRPDDLSRDLHRVNADSSSNSTENRTGVSAQGSPARLKEEDQASNFGVRTSCPLFESDANEKRPRLAVVQRFSEKLSRSVLDAVISDRQLLCSRSAKELPEKNSENAVWKFSSILADSIVRTVLDYSKVNKAHIFEGDESCHLATNVQCANNETGEGTEDATLCELKSTEDEVCNMSETLVDDAVYKDLDEYAKKLSENILNGVYQLNGVCNGSGKCSLTEVYITDLTETILSEAIKGAKCCMLENKILPDSNDQTGESLLDMFIDEIVRNVLKSVISRVLTEDPVEHAEIEKHNDNYQNGDGYQTSKTSECDNRVGENRNSGKFQSKWLNEDDLDELHEDDLSEEEDQEIKVRNNPDGLTKKEETAFWRKSLIQDLDDDLEFEELESEHSSPPSSPTKSVNFETNELLADSSSSGEEVYDDSPAAKVPATLFRSKTSTSSRSRLRSVDSTPVLVFDNGSAFLKVGFCGEDAPKEVVPSVVGAPLRYSQEISGMDYSHRQGLVFGGEAIGKAGVLHIDYPMKSDVIDRWNDVEELWNYVLNSLMGIQDNPDFPVLITQRALNSKKNTEKIAEIMFEHFHMPSLYIASQPALSLFSMGFTSGLSFCSGFSSTQAAVVYEGHVLPHTVKQLDIAGYQLTETLKKLLMSGQGFGFRSSSQWQIVNDIKEKMAFVSQDFNADAGRYKSQAELQEPYELPDGQVIEVGLERFGCAETLFRPMELGLTQSPAHMLITEAINSCEEGLQETCYKSIGISGGTTLMPGFVSRLELELRECDRRFRHFTVPEHRDLSTWLGGSIVASLPTFREMVVTVDEYADVGARVLHSKCF